jgi:hypothetical protein
MQERFKTWVELPPLGEGGKVEVTIRDTGVLSFYREGSRTGYPSFIDVAAKDVAPLARWILSKSKPDASIWDRLAAHSAVPASAPEITA